MTEWYSEVLVSFRTQLDPCSEEYTERADNFWCLLEEFLGEEACKPTLFCNLWNVETFVYVDAETKEEAAALSARPFLESVEVAWGPGTRAEVLRTITADERDRELEAEGISLEPVDDF